MLLFRKCATTSSVTGGDSPSSVSNQSKLDWSPGEVIPRANSMDMYVSSVRFLPCIRRVH